MQRASKGRGRPRSTRVLTGIASLSDEAVLEGVLGNWHKLNAALACGPSLEELQRLLALELRRGREARPLIVERIRSRIQQLMNSVSKDAAAATLKRLSRGEAPSLVDLLVMGISDAEAKALSVSLSGGAA